MKEIRTRSIISHYLQVVIYTFVIIITMITAKSKNHFHRKCIYLFKHKLIALLISLLSVACCHIVNIDLSRREAILGNLSEGQQKELPYDKI